MIAMIQLRGMKPARFTILNPLAALSLALFIASIILWTESYRSPDSISLGYGYSIMSMDGRFYLMSFRVEDLERLTMPPNSMVQGRDGVWTFTYHDPVSSPVQPLLNALHSYWLTTLAAAILPAFWSVRRLVSFK